MRKRLEMKENKLNKLDKETIVWFMRELERKKEESLKKVEPDYWSYEKVQSYFTKKLNYLPF